MKIVIWLVGILIVIIVAISLLPFTVIKAGYRGVVFNNGSGVEDRILGEGFHFITPFVESVSQLSIQVQKNEVKADAASKDLQTVNADLVINWHLDAGKVNKVYQTIGDEKAIVDRILNPAVSEVVKSATAQYTAEDLITKRTELKAVIDESLKERLATYNVILDDLSIVNIDFSKEFNAAIEAKQVAEQQAKQAFFLTQKAQNEASASVAQARGVAESQKLVQQTITPELLQKMTIEKWNGIYPTYVGGGLPLPTLPLTK